ncbi:AAA family ATPase [Candidatus Uabimicrobium amorphum]|uniref:ATPase n=1 Tax=Uabimicrobium amorphum TaxID=2596890 RepID=A0A5S9IJA1_UABAM|nr:AAA family ATPase [Candidatus Uabimicrobium amorphum]BBM82551.1 ATPase [Candidatus Uabimicrobium amorphum]
MHKNIIFVIGLTGVGKSSTLEVLLHNNSQFLLLPNRRKLTDDIIIPHIQKMRGEELQKVGDRAKRFEMTAAYREIFPDGMAHVVAVYLQQREFSTASTLVFDNLRGVNEVRGAIEKFPETTRFVMLDAPEEVRLQRLLGRQDEFDQVTLENIMQHDAAVDGVSAQELAKAKKIIHSEKQNYDAQKTAAFLKENLSRKRLCYVDTSNHNITQVNEIIQEWLQCT